MPNRIRLNSDGTCDDIFIEASSVHIEQLSDHHVWIVIEGINKAYYSFEVWSKSGKAVVDIIQTDGPVF